MNIRKMTAEEKRGKAICADCTHCVLGLPASELYCAAKVDKVLNYITGEVEEDELEDKHNCAHWNDDGCCQNFQKNILSSIV